jgi:hypothetical protein
VTADELDQPYLVDEHGKPRHDVPPEFVLQIGMGCGFLYRAGLRPVLPIVVTDIRRIEIFGTPMNAEHAQFLKWTRLSFVMKDERDA